VVQTSAAVVDNGHNVYNQRPTHAFMSNKDSFALLKYKCIAWMVNNLFVMINSTSDTKQLVKK